MILEDKERNTDRGWNSLYQRLQQDGLLPSEDEKRVSTHTLHVKRWVASIAILIACVASLYLWLNVGVTEPEKKTVANGAGEPTLVTILEDGSAVYLSEETTIEYPLQFAGDKREISLRGDAFFEITGNRERPFIIHTALTVVEVLGTSFNVVSKGNDAFSLSVKSGMVKVTAKPGKESIEVRAGETALLDLPSGKLERFPSANEAAFAGYLRHVHFKDQRIGHIVRVMNERTGSIKLRVAPEVEGLPLTVTFSGESPQEIARLIGLALNLVCEEHADHIYITRR